jgi:hypothetical protein
MKSKPLEDGSVLHFDDQAVMQVHDFGAGVSLHVRQGIMSKDFATVVIEDGERHLRKSGRFVLMVDGSETKMHTTEFREKTTNWFRERETASVHMLTRSRMVEMALNVSNLAMGATRATTYLDPKRWEAVGRLYVSTFSRRQLVLPTKKDRG